MLAIMSRIERMVARGDSFMIEQILVGWADNLDRRARDISNCYFQSVQENAAYKSIMVC